MLDAGAIARWLPVSVSVRDTRGISFERGDCELSSYLPPPPFHALLTWGTRKQTWRGMMAPTAAIRRRAPPPAASRPSAGRGAPSGGVVKRTVVTVTDEGEQSVTVEHQPGSSAAGGGGGGGATSMLSSSPSSKTKDSLNITFVDEYDPARPNDFFGFQSEFVMGPVD